MPADLEKLNATHRQWWKQFWSESFVEIGDPILERFYYSSQYVIASSSRTGKVAPGLYGNWVTTDHPSWNGDYTLNYNHQTPFQALYSSNHIATSDSYDPPVLDFLNRAKIYARTMLNVRGAYYPGHIGPWGLERPFDYDPFMGQKSDAAYLAAPMMCAGDFNPITSLVYTRVVFKGLIDLSAELGLDAGRRDKWRHILDHLSALPTEERKGKIVFREAERGSPGAHHGPLYAPTAGESISVMPQ